MPRVFISHTTKDREFVEREIVSALHQHGIDTWYSPDDISTADLWERSIVVGPEECDWFLVVMSRQAQHSKWVKSEVSWAVEYRHGRIVPVLVEDCDAYKIHLNLITIQHVDFRSSQARARENLVALFTGATSKPGTVEQPGGPVAGNAIFTGRPHDEASAATEMKPMQKSIPPTTISPLHAKTDAALSNLTIRERVEGTFRKSEHEYEIVPVATNPIQFHHAVLENGLEVVAELNDHVHSIAAGFFVKVGSRDESVNDEGVANATQMMAFRGTARRDSSAINRDFDRAGAKHNAETSEEHTFYHATCLPEYLPKVFDVLAEILQPSLSAAGLEIERKVLLNYITTCSEDRMHIAYEQAKAVHFGPGSLGRSILGSTEAVTNLKIDQLRNFHIAHYGPQNIVLAFAGKGNWGELVTLAQSHCGHWHGGTVTRRTDLPTGSRGLKFISRPDHEDQTIVAVADAPPLESSHRYAARLLADIIGAPSASRLFREVVDIGLADGAELSYQSYDRAGAYFTFLACPPESSQQSIDRIMNIYSQAIAGGVSEGELNAVKNRVGTVATLRGERPMGRLLSIGSDWMYRRRYFSLASELARFSAVTVDDIRQLLAQWPLLPQTIICVGPANHIKDPFQLPRAPSIPPRDADSQGVLCAEKPRSANLIDKLRGKLWK
jgi:predicted Zn-dependent peptidase